MLREAAFAGQFYPGTREKLEKNLSELSEQAGKGEHNCSVVVAPHAGYIYSGKTAAFAYAALKNAKTYFIISPNHTGLGDEISIYPTGTWETPLGKIEINGELSRCFAEKLEIEFDDVAHAGEHSLEVQLPFLQHNFSGFKIVAITLATDDLGKLKKIAKAIYDCSKWEDVAVIASSDFTHFEPEEAAREKDLSAVKLVEGIEVENFHKLVLSNKMSICGFSAIVVAMEFCRLSGIEKGRLLKYATSADCSGDCSSVVGYAAISFK